MWKNVKKWILAGMMTAAMAGLGSSEAGAQGTDDDSPKLIYAASDVEWLENGTKLVVYGSFYNMSSEYDVIGIKEGTFYIVDSEEKEVITMVDINTEAVSVVPHNGACTYNFVINDLEGAENAYQRHKAYGANGVYPSLEAEFYYDACEGVNCSYCGGIRNSGGKNSGGRNSTQCSECRGTGRSDLACLNCGGSGVDPAYEITKGSVLHGFTEKDCAVCNGSGYQKCSFCGGTGKK